MNQQYEDEGLNDDDIQKQERLSERRESKIFEITFDIVHSAMWALLFVIFRYYNSEECYNMELWTLIVEIFLISSILYKIIVKLPIYYYVNETTRNSIFSFTDKVEFFIGLVIIFGLTYAFFQFEHCNTLRMFALTYILISYTVLIVFGCIHIIGKNSPDI